MPATQTPRRARDEAELPEWLACRPQAATYLQSLIAGRNVICERKDIDRYGRTVAVCRAGGEDLGALRQGMAWAFVRYSKDYVAQEERARQEWRGAHFFDGMTSETASGKRKPKRANAKVNAGEAGHSTKREILELVRAYCKITDASQRKSLTGLVIALAEK